MQNKFSNQTLHNLAGSLRHLLIDTLGEREFTRQLVSFDHEVAGELKQVLVLVLTTAEPATFQMALLWLDGRGYGKKLNWRELVELRSKLNKLSAKASHKELKRLLEPGACLITLWVRKQFKSKLLAQPVTSQFYWYQLKNRNLNLENASSELNLAWPFDELVKDNVAKRKPLFLVRLLYYGLILGLAALGWLGLSLFSVGAPELAIPVLGLFVLVALSLATR
jgi:hypothetical protein